MGRSRFASIARRTLCAAASSTSTAVGLCSDRSILPTKRVADSRTVDVEWFGRHYVLSEADADNPYASVLRADLHELPPAFVITAECDPLRDDGEAYADRLRELGIAARYKRYPGMFHGFMGFPGALPEASEAFNDAGLALREALA